VSVLCLSDLIHSVQSIRVLYATHQKVHYRIRNKNETALIFRWEN